MKQIAVFTLLFSNLNVLGQSGLQELINAHRNKYLDKAFPEFNLKTNASDTFSNSNLQNKVVFVNFWFESCLPCIQEIDGLNKLYDKLKTDTNFIFVSFTFEPYVAIENFKRKNNIAYNIYHMETTKCDKICCGYPTSFILDKKGLIRQMYFGGSVTKEEATTVILNEIYPTILKLL